jgi:hypothetical protein
MPQSRAVLSKYIWRILLGIGALVGLGLFGIFVSQLAVSNIYRGIAANKATGLSSMGFPQLSYSKSSYSQNSGDVVVRALSLGIEVPRFDIVPPRLVEITQEAGGFVEQLDIHRQLGAQPWLEAKLRLPAAAMDSALRALRNIGEVQQESESTENTNAESESLTRQLESKRAELKRLSDIVQHRLGSLNDTVQAEEKLSQRRNELNDLENQLTKLDARVEYALVDLRITERYQAHLDWRAAVSISDLRNSFVEGLAAVLESFAAILGILFHYGLPIAFWFAILYRPSLALWRRYGHTQPLPSASGV